MTLAGEPVGRVVTGDTVEVVAFIRGQAQRPCYRRQHLLARLRAAPLLQSRVVVGGHGGEQRDLLAAESGGATARAGRQADIRGMQRLAVATQEVGECSTVHVSIMTASERPNQGSPIPG